MTRCPNTKVEYEDRMVKRWFCQCCGWRSQGKRLPYSSSLFERRIQKLYVERYPKRAISLIMFEKGLGSQEALEELNRLRGMAPEVGKKWLIDKDNVQN